MLKVGIIGTRRRDTATDLALVRKVVNHVLRWHNVEEIWIVSGGCPKGGDRFAEIIAKERGWPITIFFPNWKRFGKRAGFVRNTKIAEESDFVIACVAADRTGGTEDTIQKAEGVGKDVILVNGDWDKDSEKFVEQYG